MKLILWYNCVKSSKEVLMDYNYSEKNTVKLDCKTERAICEIKDALKDMASGLDSLHRKVERLANKEYMESQGK